MNTKPSWSAHLVHRFIKQLRDVEPVNHMDGSGKHFENDLEVRSPHVTTHITNRGQDVRAQFAQAAPEIFLGMTTHNPQPSALAFIHLVNQGHVGFIALSFPPVQFVNAYAYWNCHVPSARCLGQPPPLPIHMKISPSTAPEMITIRITITITIKTLFVRYAGLLFTPV
jgi:hypothetical protein